jgi:hypothetical protein
MRIAIVTVCRDAAATLGRCLDGVAEQGVAGLVHVVQDGASTDGSAALLAAHAARVDLRLVSEPDGGQNDALLRALARCPDVDLVGFVWADETLLPGSVARARAAFAADPSLVAVYGDVLDTDLDGTPRGLRTAREWSLDAVARYEDIPPVCGAFVRPAVIRALRRLAAAAPGCTEWLLWLAAGATGPVRRLPAVQASYARHPAQLSRQPAAASAYAVTVADAAYALARDPSVPAALRAQPETAAAHVHLQAGEWLALVAGDADGAFRHLECALAHTPQARLLPVHVWLWSERWLAAAQPALVHRLLARVAHAGVRVPVAGFLAAAACLVAGDDDGASAAILDLADDVAFPDAVPSLAAAVRGVAASGPAARAETLVVRLARLAQRVPAWRPPFALLLAQLQRFEEALAAATDLDDGDPHARALRVQLELYVTARDPAVRHALGRLSARPGGLTLDEATGLAQAAARLLAGRATPSAALVEALIVFHRHARAQGYAAFADALETLMAPRGGGEVRA